MNVARRSFEWQGSRQFVVLRGACWLIWWQSLNAKTKTTHHSLFMMV